jgi:hypothetical protein
MEIKANPLEIVLQTEDPSEENLNDSWYDVEAIFSANYLYKKYKGK